MAEYNSKRFTGKKGKRVVPVKRVVRIFSTTFLLIFAGFFLYNCYNFFTVSSIFSVKDVEVIGNNRLSAEDIVCRVGLEKNQNIFLIDISVISAAIRDNPWVKDVSVSRLLPDKLSVKLIERHPVAIINREGNYLVGDDGTLMERIDDYASIPLPLLLGTHRETEEVGGRLESDLVSSLIDTIAACAESSFIFGKGIRSVEMLHNNKINLVTRQDNISIIINKLYLDEALKKLDSIEEFIGSSFVKKIDLSFKGQAVVI